ncbi:hypothetical protein [Roseateles toxinivorans]|nr:hypothetical protein [Roseateles toxinivorans]
MSGALDKVALALAAEPQVVAAAVALLLIATFGYLVWFRRHMANAYRALESFKKLIDEGPKDWPHVQQRLREQSSSHRGLLSAWQQTEERVVLLPGKSASAPFFFGAPRDLWAPQRLVGPHLNLHLAEAVPNLLVGAGLLLTFFFLSLALLEATSALVAQNQGQTDLLAATRNLLAAAGGKFLTSLAGLLASIIWTVLSRRRMTALARAGDEVVDALLRVVPANGAEASVRRQLELTQAELESARNREEIVEAQQAISEELLNEAREQSGSLKRFETDLAVTIGKAVTDAFSPQMQAMTERLVGAIEGLSNRLGSMNEQALERMLQEFSSSLKASSAEEMESFRGSLGALAGRLDEAAEAIEARGKGAADALGTAGEDIAARLGGLNQALEDNAKNLSDAAHSLKVAVNDFDVTLVQVTDAGGKGLNAFKTTLSEANTTIERMGEAADEWQHAVSTLDKAAGALTEGIDAAEEFSRAQRVVVDAVRQATPQAMDAVTRVTKVLESTNEAVVKATDEARKNLDATSAALGDTVARITEGIGEYSRQVTEVHRMMDNNFAKATGSFDKAVTGLEEAIEELSETLGTRAAA